MDAEPGNWVVVLNGANGGRREGQIVEVIGRGGQPPYRVRWLDGRQTLFFPGPDAQVVAAPPHAAARRGAAVAAGSC